MNTLEPIAIEIIGRLAKLPGYNNQLEEVLQELPYSDRATLTRQLISRADLNILEALETQEDRFKVYTAHDALQPLPPIEWLVEDVFRIGTVNVLYGASGVMKTSTMLDMATCVALGKPWLGRETIQGAVLYLDEDNGEIVLKPRLGDVQRGHLVGENDSLPIYCTSLASLNLGDEEEFSNIEALVRQYSARLIVIDTLINSIPGADEDRSKAMNPVFRPLRKIAQSNGATFVVIHHEGKNGTMRGSSAIIAASDCALNLKSGEGKPLNLKSEKNRHGKQIKFSALAHWQEGQFWLSPCEGEEEPGRQGEELSRAKKFVLRYLGQHGAATVETIKANAVDCSSDQARNAVYALRDVGLTVRTNPEQPGGRANPAIYDLTDKGKELLDKLAS